jgi:hypothetical protein
MHRRNHRWRVDRLGSLLSAGLCDVRTATPSPGLWDKIDEAIDPPRPRLDIGRFLRRFAADPGAGVHVGPGLLTWIALPGATVLSVLILFAVVLQGVNPSPWATAMRPSTRVVPTSFGLTEPEFAMQPELDQRLVSVALPSGPTDRDAPPQAPRYPFRPDVRAAEDAPSLGLISQ